MPDPFQPMQQPQNPFASQGLHLGELGGYQPQQGFQQGQPPQGQQGLDPNQLLAYLQQKSTQQSADHRFDAEQANRDKMASRTLASSPEQWAQMFQPMSQQSQANLSQHTMVAPTVNGQANLAPPQGSTGSPTPWNAMFGPR